MPAVNVAMERSLRGGLLDLVAASLRPLLESRDSLTQIGSDAESVKTAFSSWDNCMAASICKWPVIAIIVVGGLIVLGVAWCIIRCACCGLACCCQCCQCLKCCGNCCGCCDPPKGSSHKYLDTAPYIPPNQGYKSQDPMSASAFPPASRIAPIRANEPPQYAEFDVSKKGGRNEDALPEMPTWGTAGTKKIALEEEEAVEMNELKKPDAGEPSIPLMTGSSATRGPASPAPSAENRSPYRPMADTPGSSGYLPPAGYHAEPYAQGGQDYNQTPGFGQPEPSQRPGQGYGMAAPGIAPAMGPGRRSPRAYGEGGYSQDPGYTQLARQGSFDNYGRPAQGSSDAFTQQGPQGYGAGPRRSPRDMQGGAGPDRMRKSPAPQGDFAYGGNYNNPNASRPFSPPRQYSSDSTRPLVRPPPQRQYSNDVTPQSPPNLQSNGGFDFGSGYSRPSTGGNNSSSGYSYDRRPTLPQLPPQQPAQQQEPKGYPGYRSYQPSSPTYPPHGGQPHQESWGGI